MKNVLRGLGLALRYGAPIAWAVLHLVQLPSINLGEMMVTLPAARGARLLWVVLGAGALMRWPRLWIVAPSFFIARLPYHVGERSLIGIANAVGTIFMVLTLFLIGVTSLWRRLPGPLPHIKGTIVPNADGVGALLSLPIVLALAVTERYALLFWGCLLFALWRVAAYLRKGALLTRGRGWLTFFLAVVFMALFCFYRLRPDWAAASYNALRVSVPYAILAWAIQRAIVPYRIPTTEP